MSNNKFEIILSFKPNENMKSIAMKHILKNNDHMGLV